MGYRGYCLLAATGLVWFLTSLQVATALSLKDAVQRSVSTNPLVGEAVERSRATQAQLRQAQGALLPKVDLGADFGKQRIHRTDSTTVGDGDWLSRRQVSLSVSQKLFDGFATYNEIYRQQARVDAAALRIMERSETLGLDAVEAYIDVRRQLQLVALSRKNENRHKELLSLVRARFSGGKASVSERDQAEERVAATGAVTARLRLSLAEARARFRRITGVVPHNLRRVGFATRLPKSRKSALAIAVRNNPALQASQAEIDASGYEYDKSRSAFMPRIDLEGDATGGRDVDGIRGRKTDLSARITLKWSLFNGGIDTARRDELSARLGEVTQRRDGQLRQVREVIEKSWDDLHIGRSRVSALERQKQASRRVVTVYEQEYKLSKRTLLDLLDSENALFNTRVQLANAGAIRIFSSYRLLATMGKMLDSMGISKPSEGFISVRGASLFPSLVEPLR